MSETRAKHTPGPWVVHGRDGPTRPIRIGRDEVGPCYTLAAVYQPVDGKQSADANARLMAAAPDLLAALESAVTAMEVLEHPEDWGALARARAAIAKAKGA